MQRSLGHLIEESSLPSRRHPNRSRRGSTLLVVLALLGMLSLLGLIYFSFANQEQQNATYFAEAAKGTYQEDDIERIFSAAMKQIVVGAEPTQPNSVMWGRRHSMLYNLIGFDVQPHNGTGVNLIRAGNALVVDQDHNGTADVAQPGYDLRNVNDSPAANFLFQRDILRLPAPDVDYTYPDHNNMFLGYKGYTWDYRLNPPAQRLVIKPAFHRPELFRTNAGAPMADWAIAQSTAGRSFRAHPFHAYVWRQDTSGTPQRRFIIDASSNPAGDPTLAGFVAADAALIGASVTNQVTAGFPFLVNLNDPTTGAPDGNFSEQGVFSANANVNPIPGPGNVTAWNQYEYDVDNDGDNVPDGIWMDFDLPILVRPSDNRPYIPLISAAIYDLDSLLNVNMVGNTFGDTRTSNTSNFGNGGPISVSAQGLSSPSEISPLYALNTTYAEASAEAQADLAAYFGHIPATPNVNWSEMANMEYWMSLKGHVRYSTPNQIYAGRFGEANRMWNVLQAGGAPISVQNSNSNLFPFPGIYDIDDNRDANEGHRTWMGGTAVGTIESFRHPLLFGGRGRYWTGSKQPQLYSVAGNPMVFLKYDNVFTGFDALNSNTVLTGVPQWYGLDPFSSGTNPLMTNTLLGANYGVPNTGAPFPNPAGVNNYTLVDDSMEVTVAPNFIQRPYDEPFEAIDTLFLQMSNADRNATGLSSRLANTMPGNLVIPTGSSNPNQVDVGQRFTSLSWDLKHLGLPRTAGPGPDGQPGWANRDDNNNGLVDESAELGFPATDDDRAWEFNVDTDSDGLLEFPPQFNPVLPGSGNTPFVPNRPENAYRPRDPFRPQLRRLMSFEMGSTTDATASKRLSINEFLDVERRPNTTPSSYTSPLQYRQLTPHSIDNSVQSLPIPTPVSPVPTNAEPYTLPPFPPVATPTNSIEEVREFWARRDRQQMARDIYVLLYTFCGGNDSVQITTHSGTAITTTGNLTTNSGFEVYPVNVRRQMAQFAVNFVDALDADNVVTAFEFDHNLLDGWDLDDDPSTLTAAESASLTAGERELVFGVETPQLTFSEVVWYRQPQQASDNSQTPFDDTTGDFNFVQFELRSIFPQPVQLADAFSSSTNANTGIWRIVRDDSNGDSNNDGDVLDPGENALTFANGIGAVASGGLFTIANSDFGSLGLGGNQASAMYIDHTGAMTDFELVVPSKNAPAYDTATGQPSPVVDLDLLHPAHATNFALANGGPGDFLSRTNNPATNTDPNKLPGNRTVFRLQRRLNPRLPKLSLTANPFVTVDVADHDATQGPDTIGFAGGNLSFDSLIANQASALIRLQILDASTERSQPLNNNLNSGLNGLTQSGGMASSPVHTTLSAANSGSPPMFGQQFVFLPHFDRDYSSIVELFHIPLFGPERLTRDAPHLWLSPEFNSSGTERGQLKLGSGLVSFGAAVLLESEDRDHNGGAPASSEDLNDNGVLDNGEDTNANGQLDFGEDLNNNGILDSHPYHFHRLFAFVEVPTRTHRQLGDPLLVNRVPGRLNLNGIRDPYVFAGLLDDREVHGLPERDLGGPKFGYTEDKNLNGVLDAGEDLNGNNKLDIIPPDANEDLNGNGNWDRGLFSAGYVEPLRDWWLQFLVARDGYDTTSGMSLPLSGISRPFRDIGLMHPTIATTNRSSIEDTILRRLPEVTINEISLASPINTNGNARRLFELRASNKKPFEA